MLPFHKFHNIVMFSNDGPGKIYMVSVCCISFPNALNVYIEWKRLGSHENPQV